ncbi:MAG: C25 family peptidase propeptide domain-containing protein, partial [Anaerolineae bacterium]|nr:C25 family peptidase propeptide domain-containing protein [Anaerolineae bacterium]
MNRRWFIWLITLLLTTGLFLFAADSQAQSEPQWSLTILESDSRHLLLELTLPGFEIETVTYDKVDYQRLAVDQSWSRWGTPGQPLLPIYNVLVGMPWPGDPQVSILDIETELFDNYYLYPTPELAFGHSQGVADFVELFALDQATYDQDVTYPGFLAEATANGFMREQPLFQLRLSPFQFNPVQRWMTVARRMKILVTFPPAPAEPSPTAPVSASFQQSLQRLLINYPALPVAQAIPRPSQAVQTLSNEGSYIIITHPNFFDAVQELATYRTSQGESVVVKKSDEIYAEFSGGTKSAQAIRDYLT